MRKATKAAEPEPAVLELPQHEAPERPAQWCRVCEHYCTEGDGGDCHAHSVVHVEPNSLS